MAEGPVLMVGAASPRSVGVGETPVEVTTGCSVRTVTVVRGSRS
jgi:hypothetical protein